MNYNDPKWAENGVTMIDCDPDWPMRVLLEGLPTKEGMLAASDKYFDEMSDGASITDMSFSVFQQTSYVKTKNMDWIYQTITEKEKAGKIDKESIRWRQFREKIPPLYEAFEKYDLDWAEVAIDGCRKKGIRPWVYFRMNDLHVVDADTSLFHDSFFFKARENGWLIGNEAYGHPLGTSGNIRNLLDFSHVEVREWLLTYIEEMMMRYDVFGFELDFMRNIYCFDYLRAEPGYQEHMNDFIRRVRGILTRAEEKFGHDIKLAVRLGHSVDNNFVYGFDVKTWVKEGLVDALIPACEEVCNSGVDVREWRRVIGDDVALFIGYDSHVIRWLVYEAECIHGMREDHLKAFAARYFNLGADGVYFNNYYYPTEKKARFISRESAERGLRTLVVTHEDIVPIGCEGYKPLPIALGGSAEIELNMGHIRPGERVYVTAGYDKEDVGGVSVFLDGKESVSSEKIKVVPDRVEGHYYDEEWNFLESASLVRYEFENFTTDGDFTVTFNGSGVNLVYLEVSAMPEKIK